MKTSLPLAFLLLAAACGGQVTSTGDGGPASGSSSGASASGSGGSGGGGSSSGAVTVPPCPNELPDVGAICSAPGQERCAYITGAACQAFVCGSDSLWEASNEGC